MSWILNALSKELAEVFLYATNAYELWKELKERFGDSNGPLMYQLMKEISNANQANNNLMMYYTKLKKLWENFNFLNCETCKKECNGRLDYDNLCSNLNYLKEYAEKNYDKNKQSFVELKKIMGNKNPTIFSFGCGLGLDYIGAVEVFGEKLKYYGIDECEWAIKKTNAYKNFKPKLPKTIKFDVGTFLLNGRQENLVLCFFNSLFTISSNTDLDKLLVNALRNQDEFYLLCDYTINSNYHMPKEEQDFIKKLTNKLKNIFKFKRFEFLERRGILIHGER